MINNTELMSFLKAGWSITEIITDLDGNKTIYQGKSAGPDVLQNMARWCIKKTTITTVNNVQTVVEEYADGNLEYDNVWNDRASLTYKYL